MIKKILIITWLLSISCSTKYSKNCDMSNFEKLSVTNRTINNENIKKSKEYNIRIYQFDVDLDISVFKLCNLNDFDFKLLGEYKNEYNPQRAYLKISKKKNDSLYFQLYNSAYVLLLNEEYNHYSMYLDKNGKIESLDGHKDEFLYYD